MDTHGKKIVFALTLTTCAIAWLVHACGKHKFSQRARVGETPTAASQGNVAEAASANRVAAHHNFQPQPLCRLVIMRERLLTCLFVVSLGVVLVGLGCEETAPRLAKGDLVPGFQTTDLDGRTLQFPADYQGRIIALRFWAEWCPYCEKEMRELEPIYRDFAQQGFSILALNVGQSRETAQRFIRGLGVSYDVGLDESSEIARRYGVLALPTTFIIDHRGRVLRKILGEADAETFRTLVKELLSS